MNQNEHFLIMVVHKTYSKKAGATDSAKEYHNT